VRYFQGFLVGHPRQFPLLDTQSSFRDIEDSVLPEDVAA
jgi:hypothetical protein